MRNIATFLLLSCLVYTTSLFAQQKSTRQIADTAVYFDFGKATLLPQAQIKLNELVQNTPKTILGFIRITAHTDSIGSIEDNVALSEKRGQAVLDYLVQQGIAPNLKFYTAYDGEHNPVADNASEQGRQQNRRVEIQVFEEKTVVITKPKPLPPKVITHPKPIVKIKPQAIRLQCRVTDEETGKTIASSILYKGKSGTKTIKNPTGTVDITIQDTVAQAYDFEIFAPNYFHNSTSKTVYPKIENKVEVSLKPIKKGVKLTLKNLLFHGNQDKLIQTSMPELRRLKRSLEMNPTVMIEIGGHINYPDVRTKDLPKWSVKLSERRAEVIYNYLVNSGINSKRLTFKSYTNTQMLYPHPKTEWEQAQNRRVEVKVTGFVAEE